MINNGYRPLQRNDFYLVQEGVLKREECLFFIFVCNQMHFDPDTESLYGTFEVDIPKYLKVLGYSQRAPNSIYKKLDRLTEVGLINPVGEPYGQYSVNNYKRYIAQTKRWKGEADQYREIEMNITPKTLISSICAESRMQSIENDLQMSEQKVQLIEKQNDGHLKLTDTRDLSSSKEESLITMVKSTHNTDFYQKLVDQEKYQYLTPDDLRWISEVQYPTFEDKNNQASDNDIAEVFFGGNVADYWRATKVIRNV